jgi:hypothetical protein
MTDTLTQPAAPLSLFSPADGELEVVEIQGQDGSSRRMCELGICPGKRLRFWLWPGRALPWRET